MADILTITRQWLKQLEDELGRLRRKVDRQTESADRGWQDDGPFPAKAAEEILDGDVGSVVRQVNEGTLELPKWSDSSIGEEEATNRTGHVVKNGTRVDVYREPSAGTLIIVRGGLQSSSEEEETDNEKCVCDLFTLLLKLTQLAGKINSEFAPDKTMGEAIAEARSQCGCGTIECDPDCEFVGDLEIELDDFVNDYVVIESGPGYGYTFEASNLNGNHSITMQFTDDGNPNGWHLKQDITGLFTYDILFNPAPDPYNYKELNIRIACGRTPGGIIGLKVAAWVTFWVDSNKEEGSFDGVTLLGSGWATTFGPLNTLVWDSSLDPPLVPPGSDCEITDRELLSPYRYNKASLPVKFSLVSVPAPPPVQTTSEATYIHLVREAKVFPSLVPATWRDLDTYDTEGESQNVTVTLANGRMVFDISGVFEATINLAVVHDSDVSNRDVEMRVYNYTDAAAIGEIMPFKIEANTTTTLVTVSTVFRLPSLDVEEFIAVQIGNGGTVNITTLSATVYVNRIAD